MIYFWNFRGINNISMCREISSRLNSMNPDLAILVETSVKVPKANYVRNKLGNKWSFFDNYSKHNNGRIWVLWDDSKIKVKCISCTYQLIHCGVSSLNGEFKVWCTAIYVFNTLD